ncbi:Uncharacterized protein dnm_006310 [Desulfonema magnum]|uniref:Uncharacterized protein n=1 Tax=Desulfonema magnum TaxID=45655 RepID=A0A975BFU4_9BACT|nr:Uncharacterized protein dnm_006310 [Desulfonema magnum]
MERAVLWFKCAAVHDPVRPVVRRPAALGWEAKHRQVDLVIERPPGGEELLRRMKGWFSADVYLTIDTIRPYGKLKILDDYHLVVETKDMADMDSLSDKLAEVFDEEVWVEHIPKTRLA